MRAAGRRHGREPLHPLEQRLGKLGACERVEPDRDGANGEVNDAACASVYPELSAPRQDVPPLVAAVVVTHAGHCSSYVLLRRVP